MHNIMCKFTTVINFRTKINMQILKHVYIGMVYDLLTFTCRLYVYL